MRTEAQVLDHIIHFYRRRCWWAEEDDLRQEAALAAHVARGKFDPRVGVPWPQFMRRIVNRWLSDYLWRQSSPVSGTSGAEAAGLHRADLSDTMEDAAAAADESMMDDEWRQAVRDRLEALVGTDIEKRIGLLVLLSGERPVNGVRFAVRQARAALAGDVVLLHLLAAAS